MIGEPRPITHPVKFYEKGDRPLEIVTCRQWFVRNAGTTRSCDASCWRPRRSSTGTRPTWLPLRGLGRGPQRRLEHQPPALLRRALPGLVPAGPTGEPDYAAPIVPDEDGLPVDPSTDVPPGYTADQRGVPGGFVGDPDVMDTWATSSLTPQIAGGWEDDPDLFAAGLPHGPATPGPRDHPHLAVLDGRALPPRARHPALAAHRHLRLDPRPGPQEDVQVEGQRGHPAGRCSSSTAPTPCATGRQRAARAPTPPSTRVR